jgi:hypothetical protein
MRSSSIRRSDRRPPSERTIRIQARRDRLSRGVRGRRQDAQALGHSSSRRERRASSTVGNQTMTGLSQGAAVTGSRGSVRRWQRADCDRSAFSLRRRFATKRPALRLFVGRRANLAGVLSGRPGFLSIQSVSVVRSRPMRSDLTVALLGIAGPVEAAAPCWFVCAGLGAARALRRRRGQSTPSRS